jgi:starvation-inducible DNA-binding protein
VATAGEEAATAAAVVVSTEEASAVAVSTVAVGSTREASEVAVSKAVVVSVGDVSAVALSTAVAFVVAVLVGATGVATGAITDSLMMSSSAATALRGGGAGTIRTDITVTTITRTITMDTAGIRTVTTVAAVTDTATAADQGISEVSGLGDKPRLQLVEIAHPLVRIERKDQNQTQQRKNNMRRNGSTKTAELRQRRDAPLATPTDLTRSATKDITGAMNAILADVFALYLKTKTFHWHMSGPHFRDYHLLLDEHSDQLFAMTDPIAERIRKVGGPTLKSIGHISRTQRVADNDADYVEPLDMLAELAEDNKTLAARLREAHNVCDEHRDIATASLIEVWIDETERRTWFLFEATRRRN